MPIKGEYFSRTIWIPEVGSPYQISICFLGWRLAGLCSNFTITITFTIFCSMIDDLFNNQIRDHTQRVFEIKIKSKISMIGNFFNQSGCPCSHLMLNCRRHSLTFCGGGQLSYSSWVWWWWVWLWPLCWLIGLIGQWALRCLTHGHPNRTAMWGAEGRLASIAFHRTFYLKLGKGGTGDQWN